MFDCNTFIRRMGWTQKDLAQKLDVGTSTVGMWCVGKSTPAYSVMIELFKLGMTPEEMFGAEIAKIFGTPPRESDEVFERRVKAALLNLLNPSKTQQ